jgi:hypothetical protein
MKKIFCCAVAAAALAVSIPCFAAGSPWDGTWKLNQAKSKLTGTTVTITQDGSMYTLTGGAVTFKFACDGKDYPVIGNSTISCTGSGNSYEMVSKINGKFDSKSTQTISADGTTMTSVTTGKRPDGTAYTDRETDIREGSGTGMVGTWRSTKVKNTATAVMILKVNDGVLHYEDPGYKVTSDAKLDGTSAPVNGPTVPPGMTVSNKLDNGAVTTTITLNGKDLSVDVMTLSADGKVITDVSWTPGKENEKQTYVYEKE